MSLAKFAELYRVDDPDKFNLKDWDPGDTNHLDIEKKEAKELLARVSIGCPNCRNGSMRRIAGRYC
jgi:hypothetical protein